MPPLPPSAAATEDRRPCVAVLGATGFLGRLLVREASRAGFAVRAVVRPSADPEAVSELSRTRNVSVVRCETVVPSSSSSSSSSRPSPSDSLSSALSGCSAVLCALAGRNNTGGPEGERRTRSVEVEGILSSYRAFLGSSPPPPPLPPPDRASSSPKRSVRRFVAFAPPVRLLTRNGTRRPFSEYVRAKEEMEQRLKLEAEAAFADDEREEKREEARREASATPPVPPPPPPPPRRSPVAVTIFEVAAWGRDSAPIAGALLKSRVSLVVSGGERELQPLDEGDLAARVVRGLFSASSSSSSSAPPPSPFTIVSVGGPRVLTWRELVLRAGASVGVEPLFVSVPRWFLEKALLPAVELASRSSARLSRAGYLARLAADVMATDLVAKEAVEARGFGEAKL